MYDLVLKGGTVLDPSQGIDKPLDVAVSRGKIAALSESIPGGDAAQVVNVEGYLVTPGLVDIHTHVYSPAGNQNHPDVAGVLGGVTTVADAGSLGPANFQGFSDYVLSQSQTKVYSFLSIFRDKTVALSTDPSEIDVAGVVKTARENPDVVVGVKALVAPRLVQAMGLEHVEATFRAAREAGIRVMLHIGDIGPKGQTPTPRELTVQALSMLEAGDVVTHVFSPLTGAALDTDGRVLPELLEAQGRGVTLDTSYGDFNFGWDTARSVIDQGLIPDTIGTDMELQAGVGMRQVSTRGLLEYSAYFLHLGFSLEEVVRMMTVNPAKGLGIDDRAGSLAIGREADISVLELREDRWLLEDATGASRVGSQALAPVITVKGGKVIEPGEAPHPWGWTPMAIAEAGAEVATSD
jgi:dihydroorotase